MYKQYSRAKFGIPHFLFLVSVIWLGLASSSLAQTAPTNIQISGALQQPSVTRLGVNLGDQTYWDSGQMLKNLVWQNPGFEGLAYRTMLSCAVVTANTCQDNNQGSPQPAGFWTNGTYEVMSGKQIGDTGTVVKSTAANSAVVGAGQTITFDKNLDLASGDVISVKNYFPGTGDAGWWAGASGGGSYSTETTDLSPETPGKQALLMSANGPGQSVSAIQYFDTWTGLSFIQLKGAFEITFRAKGVGGNNQLQVNADRLGGEFYVGQTITLTNSWKDYKLTFTANEDGTAVGTVQLGFSAAGGNVELDDVSLVQTNSSTSNPTAFRDEVVSALQELHPGTIRMMASASALGSDVLNQVQVPFARYREGFNVYATTVPDVAYGIHEFLQLCQTVGADPWITIPTATTPTEMTDFIEYLSGTGSDPWSALRISRGQTEPWTSVFHKIHIELGNETWNSGGKGQAMWAPGYAQWANLVFGAARKTSGFNASQFDLVLSAFAASAGYNEQNLAISREQDSMDIAPYLLSAANNEAQATMFGALFAEPELFDSPGGEVYQNMQAAAATPSATGPTTNVNVYETNLATTGGSITEQQVNELTPSVGAGLAHTDHMLQMMRLGVKVQNAFALPQYEVNGGSGLVKLWGIVVGMGTNDRRRPQFLTQALANTVIGGDMLQTLQTGANPTWNQPLSSDGVKLNGAHYLQSFAFLNGNTASVIVFNLNQTTALPIVFSGADAPSGAVEMSQITSANITDNNETSVVVQPKTQTLSGFNPAAGLKLPPFSMTLLSWTSTAAQPPQYSVAAGTYSKTQTVELSDLTEGATIYYTTNGSTPTTASTKYSGPITVSKTQTLNAIAVAAGYANSVVAKAAYTIQPLAATPTFSVAPGIYSTAQTVTLLDSTPGAVFYYTTNGSKPTAASNSSSSPIFIVRSTETISAIAAASNYSASLVATATYTIAPPTVAPTFSLATGTFDTAQSVTLADAAKGSVIFYTTDGSTPTTASKQYMNAAITVSATETIRAIAIASGYSASAVASAKYTITPPAATPVLSVPGGTYFGPKTVTITDASPGATIYYTIDGNTPTTSSPVYKGPIQVNQVEYLQANAIAPGYSVSFTVQGGYNLTVPPPTLSVAGGTYSGPQSVTVTGPLANTGFFYTTDGSAPSTASSKIYTGPITIESSQTLRVIGTAPGYAISSPTTAVYLIGNGPATPVFSLAGGNYTSAQKVSITDSTAGTTIYYTNNGTKPSSAATKYIGPITVSESETLEAIAVSSSAAASSVATVTYTIGQTSGPSFPSGFTAGSVQLNGSAALSGHTLQLTTGKQNQAGSAWYPKTVSISSFTTDFDFQLPTSTANGFTFSVQNAGTGSSSLGSSGSGLGYEGIGKSFAIVFDLYEPNVANAELIGYYANGTSPQANSASLSGTGLNLHSGDPFHVHIAYGGSTLTVVLTDKTTGASVSGSTSIDLASSIGADTAYVGFTGGTSSLTATQEILDWTLEN